MRHTHLARLELVASIAALLCLSASGAPALGQTKGEPADPRDETGEFQQADGLHGFDESHLSEEIETLDMSPDEPVGFGARTIAAGFGSLLRGSSYYHEQHFLTLETTPAGAYLDLFYLRSNFQKRYEQADSPVRIALPPRVQTGKDDWLTIRAFAEGYRQKTLSLAANTTQERVVIELEPLPNTLESLSHQYFAARTSLTFLTKEQLSFRVQEADDGISVILMETALSPKATATVESARSPIVEGLVGQQLGEDLVVQVRYSADAIERQVEVRSRVSYDAARGLHAFTIDLLPRNGRAEAVARAHAALGRLSALDVTGCSHEFDTALRSLLDPSALARALTPSGAFTDPFLRAAMRRLGEVSPGGVVPFAGGAALDTRVPIELEAALSRAADAGGYLVLLRQFAAEFEAAEYRRETLRSLIAPELPLEQFGNFVDRAEESERTCLASL